MGNVFVEGLAYHEIHIMRSSCSQKEGYESYLRSALCSRTTSSSRLASPPAHRRVLGLALRVGNRVDIAVVASESDVRGPATLDLQVCQGRA